ncbi:RluA family pseudouridine synthase [Thermocrinis jamiesonii]|uniref:RluA family pseudouridine synthase n=1 Tax=Thermocrinis jamiesonii TaxID=1302351 RepID=UPI000B2D7300|nr:RluA family pseudouridine synthase [Thermocrinis jamiesonii]
MEKRRIQEVVEFEVKEPARLDKFLTKAYPEFSRSYFQKLIEEGYVLIDDELVLKPSKKLKEGQRVVLLIPEPEKLEVLPENIPLDIIYEDESLLVIVKPCGMVVHPSPGHTSGTLVNALLYHIKDLSSVGGVERPGIVHRLDKDTMGLMVVAKRDDVHKSLSEQFKERRVLKLYRAIVQGVVSWNYKLVETNLGRHPIDRKRFTVVEEGGKYAKSEFFVKERFPRHNATLLEVKIHTGRTHQIRVHASSLGHPILGDKTYGFKSQSFPKKLVEMLKNCHMLLSYKLGFVHPRKGKWLEFEVQNVEPFTSVLNYLRESP